MPTVERAPAPTPTPTPREAAGPPTGPEVRTPAPSVGRTKRVVPASAQLVSVPEPPVAPPPAEPAVVTLNSWPWSIATVDGRTLPGHTPLRGVELAPGPHTFRFENPELHMRRTVTLTLAAGERRVVSAVLEPEDSAGGPSARATP